MPNFQNGKIYCIRSYSDTDIYIGSTTQPLSKRLTTHKSEYRRYENNRSNKYYTSFEVLQCPDAYIELLEAYPCANKEELNRREGHHIRTMDCVNKVIPDRTDQEWRQDNRQALLAQKKQHYENNKQAILIQQKQYRQDNRENIKQYKSQPKHCVYCNTTVIKNNMPRHTRNNTHKINYRTEYLRVFEFEPDPDDNGVGQWY